MSPPTSSIFYNEHICVFLLVCDVMYIHVSFCFASALCANANANASAIANASNGARCYC